MSTAPGRIVIELHVDGAPFMEVLGSAVRKLDALLEALQPPPAPPELLSVTQVAERVGVSENTVRNWIYCAEAKVHPNGLAPAIRRRKADGRKQGRVLIDWQKFQEWHRGRSTGDE